MLRPAKNTDFFYCCCFFVWGDPLVQAGFKLPMNLRIPLNFRSSCLQLQSAGIIAVSHQPWLCGTVLCAVVKMPVKICYCCLFFVCFMFNPVSAPMNCLKGVSRYLNWVYHGASALLSGGSLLSTLHSPRAPSSWLPELYPPFLNKILFIKFCFIMFSGQSPYNSKFN